MNTENRKIKAHSTIKRKGKPVWVRERETPCPRECVQACINKKQGEKSLIFSRKFSERQRWRAKATGSFYT